MYKEMIVCFKFTKEASNIQCLGLFPIRSHPKEKLHCNTWELGVSLIVIVYLGFLNYFHIFVMSKSLLDYRKKCFKFKNDVTLLYMGIAVFFYCYWVI